MEFYIYSYEIIQGGRTLLNKKTGEKNIEKANQIMHDILKSDLCVILKYKNENYKAQCLFKTNHENVFTWTLCSEKDITAYNGHEKHYVKSYPGCYIIFDNREDVCQFCIEKSTTCTAKPDEIIRGLSNTFKDKLGEYGLDIKINKKTLAKPFKEIITERICIKKEPVKRVTFEFPNLKKVQGIDAATKDFRKKLSVLASMVGVKHSLKGKLDMIGDDGNPLILEDEIIDDLEPVLYLCANNGYNLTYNFVNSGRICTKNTKQYAIYEIDEYVLTEFEIKQTAICNGTTFRLIERLDQIRRDIGDYTNENFAQ
jgi:hypothetical protein